MKISILAVWLTAALMILSFPFARADPNCPNCGGTGICPFCHGSGAIAIDQPCAACKMTGRCLVCQMTDAYKQAPSLPSAPRPEAPDTNNSAKIVCCHCHGTGKDPNPSGAGVPTFGLDQEEMYCAICQRTVLKPHYHGTCPICHGLGYTK
jgi:RecJ-like exonuclease